MQGGINDGIMALTSSLHLRDGHFLEGQLGQLFYARQWNTPARVDVIIDALRQRPARRRGEPGVAATFAAVACTYARAVGQVPSYFPVNHRDPLRFRPKPVVPPDPAVAHQRAERRGDLMPKQTFRLNVRTVTVDVHPDVRVLWCCATCSGVTGPSTAAASACARRAPRTSTAWPAVFRAGGRPVAVRRGHHHRGAARRSRQERRRPAPMQQAWLDRDVAQCGYCQPGQIMAAVALVRKVRREGRSTTDADLDGIRHLPMRHLPTRIREAIAPGRAGHVGGSRCGRGWECRAVPGRDLSGARTTPGPLGESCGFGSLGETAVSPRHPGTYCSPSPAGAGPRGGSGGRGFSNPMLICTHSMRPVKALPVARVVGGRGARSRCRRRTPRRREKPSARCARAREPTRAPSTYNVTSPPQATRRRRTNSIRTWCGPGNSGEVAR